MTLFIDDIRLIRQVTFRTHLIPTIYVLYCILTLPDMRRKGVVGFPRGVMPNTHATEYTHTYRVSLKLYVCCALCM